MTKKNKEKIVVSIESSSTGSRHVSITAETGHVSITGGTATVIESKTIPVKETSTPSKEVSDRTATEAIYNYLRYLRARGRTNVGTDEVAKTLSLPLSQVGRVTAKMHRRGVKVEQ